MQFHAVAKLSDISPGQMKPVSANGTGLLLANINGRFFAVQRKCPHMGADLCKGSLADQIVTCPKHGARFDVTNGQVARGAKIVFFEMKVKNARSFPVKIEDDTVMVGI
jgi:nitrite reductase/ring-hydroxylating ferredoxin subunit